jgi:hypothetical protein
MSLDMPKWFIAWIIFCIVAGLSLTGFIIWVIIKLMIHAGVI